MLWRTPDAKNTLNQSTKVSNETEKNRVENRATLFYSETGEMGNGDNMLEYNFQNNHNNLGLSPRASTQNHSSSADEISLFLQQILVRSSSSHSALSGHHRPEVLFSSENVSRSINDGFLGGVVGCTVGASENEADEYDCESEEGLEALVEEAAIRSSSRGSSKRTRAAEVHNLSEKRRRSRINEKMKALQTLIPNANKTDKASMLDEAIEYLKQLQLQVQMLSMRNGMSLHPLCVPGPLQLPQIKTAFGDEENRPVHLNMSGILNANQEPPTQNLYNPNQSYGPHVSNVLTSEDTFGLEASIQAHLGPFQLPNSSKGVGSDELMQHLPIRVYNSETNPLGTATASLPFDAQVSDPRGDGSLETCIRGRNRKDIGPLRLMDQHHLESKKGTRR